MKTVDHDVTSPNIHAVVDDPVFPARLPWPVAVLFIFGLGITLWWGVFRLTSALLG